MSHRQGWPIGLTSSAHTHTNDLVSKQSSTKHNCTGALEVLRKLFVFPALESLASVAFTHAQRRLLPARLRTAPLSQSRLYAFSVSTVRRRGHLRRLNLCFYTKQGRLSASMPRSQGPLTATFVTKTKTAINGDDGSATHMDFAAKTRNSEKQHCVRCSRSSPEGVYVQCAVHVES